MDRSIYSSLRSAPLAKHTLRSSSALSIRPSPLHTPFASVRQQQKRQPSTHQQTSSRPHQRRHAHSRRHVSTAVNVSPSLEDSLPEDSMPTSSSLSCIPLHALIRSYLITSVSSIPLLLRPSMATLSFMANSKSPLLNPDSNPLLSLLLKRTFYAQFCAGETAGEVEQTIADLKTMGYKGVILGHAKEVVLSKKDESQLDESIDPAEEEATNAREILEWKQNTLDTIELTQRDDFVALKFTGAGRQALQRLKATESCAPAFEQALHEICQSAEQRGVSLLFDAEQAALQQGIDNWTLYFMERYNKGSKAVVYGTYQTYAKRTPGLLAVHLDQANKKNFVLGVKLVRGAYMGSDPRELFWDTIEGTHNCYDNMAQCVMQRRYGGLLQPADSGVAKFPRVNMLLASHNADSIAKARKIRDEQARNGEERIRLAYGQLQGMADNVSCEIVQEARQRSSAARASIEVPQAYKYLVWGTLGECMKYLLRRAQENKDAVSRTIDARQALGSELLRRMGLR